jgi:hypothetical protein
LELVICFARRPRVAEALAEAQALAQAGDLAFILWSLGFRIWDLFFGACDLYLEVCSLELGI